MNIDPMERVLIAIFVSLIVVIVTILGFAVITNSKPCEVKIAGDSWLTGTSSSRNGK